MIVWLFIIACGGLGLEQTLEKLDDTDMLNEPSGEPSDDPSNEPSNEPSADPNTIDDDGDGLRNTRFSKN